MLRRNYNVEGGRGEIIMLRGIIMLRDIIMLGGIIMLRVSY